MARIGAGAKLGLDGAELAGRRVLLRVDFNTPLGSGGRPTDDSRLRAALPTIEELLEKGASVVLATHLGRPKGRVAPELSTRVLVEPLEALLGRPVAWVEDCVGSEAERRARELRPGELLLLENLRFHRGEEGNEPAFAEGLAALADIYVDDAFATAHRAHASVAAVASLLPARAGRLMEHELSELGAVLDQPERPLVAVVGGSKLSTKLGLLRQLVEQVDALCLGGAMAATFLKAAGREVGTSLVEDDFLDSALEVVARASKAGVDLELPVDVVVAPSPEAQPALIHLASVEEIAPEEMVLDLGPETVERFGQIVARAGTVVWNGPLGLFERPAFAAATEALARAIAKSPARSIAGGGDLQAALHQLGLEGGFTHVSSGGGATLELLEGKELPGVAALPDAPQGSARR